MPGKSPRLTFKQKRYVQAAALVDNPVSAAKMAGYDAPDQAAWRFMRDPRFIEATREAGAALLREKGGAIGIGTLISIAMDEKQAAGARVAASTQLVKLAGMAVGEGQGERELHEMTGAELAEHRAKLEAQVNAMTDALANRAKPVLEGEAIKTPDAQATPNAFD